MAAKNLLSNFSKGELGPQLYARTDIPQYAAGVKEAKNFIIQRYGGMTFRPGFRFAGEVDDVNATYRLTSFKFSNSQAYVHLHGPLQMRVLARGGFVVEDDLKIISATIEAQTVLEIPYHGMAVGDRFFIDGITGMTLLNGRYGKVVAVPDANHVRVDINTTDYAALAGSTGITRTGPPDPPPAPPAPLPDPTPPPEPPPSGSGGDDDGLGSDSGSGGVPWYRFGDERV